MINTPEFWVGISFLICGILAIKWILPGVLSTLRRHQTEIETLFLNAEIALETAEKRFSITQSRLHSLPQHLQSLEKEFDTKVSHQLMEWSFQKDRITERYRHLQQHKVQHLIDHVRGRMYDRVIEGCMNVLQVYFSKHLSANVHQQLVVDSLIALTKV